MINVDFPKMDRNDEIVFFFFMGNDTIVVHGINVGRL